MVGDFCKGGGVTIHCLNKQNMLAESLLLISFLSVSSKWGVTRHPFHPPWIRSSGGRGFEVRFFFLWVYVLSEGYRVQTVYTAHFTFRVQTTISTSADQISHTSFGTPHLSWVEAVSQDPSS